MGKKIGQKDWLTALLLSLFFGVFGVDRMYLGYAFTGLLKLLTFGGGGVWAIIDALLILKNKLPDSKGQQLYKQMPPQELIESGEISKREWIVAFIYSIAFGWMGADRFYLGRKWYGLLKLSVFLLLIIVPVWTLVGFVNKFMAGYQDIATNSMSLVYGTLGAMVGITILIFLSIVLWIVDVILIGFNNLNDALGKSLWRPSINGK